MQTLIRWLLRWERRRLERLIDSRWDTTTSLELDRIVAAEEALGRGGPE